MSRPILLHPEAVAEAAAAYGWYRRRSASAARRFRAEFELAGARITETPGAFPEQSIGTRRYLLHRFPYHVVYRERGEAIEVIAVAHAKRRPGYWKSR